MTLRDFFQFSLEKISKIIKEFRNLVFGLKVVVFALIMMFTSFVLPFPINMSWMLFWAIVLIIDLIGMEIYGSYISWKLDHNFIKLQDYNPKLAEENE